MGGRPAARRRAGRGDDHGLLALSEVRPLTPKEIAARARDDLAVGDDWTAEEVRPIVGAMLSVIAALDKVEDEADACREALKAIEAIRLAAAGPNEPLPHSARVEIGRIVREALARDTEKP